MWFILAVLASFLWSITTVMDKYILQKYKKFNGTTYQMAQIVFNIPILILILLFFEIQFNLFSIICIGLGIAGILALILYSNGIKKEEASRVSQIICTMPLFTVILASIFIEEQISLQILIGILLLVVGALFASWKKENKKWKFSEAIIVVLIFTFISASCDVVIKWISGNGVSIMSIVFWQIVGNLLAFPIFYIITKKNVIKMLNKSLVVLFSAKTVLYYSGLVLLYTAISTGLVSAVNATVNIEPLIIMGMIYVSNKFLKHKIDESFEKENLFVKLAALIFVIVGCVLINF